jgi:hypothetical protein
VAYVQPGKLIILNLCHPGMVEEDGRIILAKADQTMMGMWSLYAPTIIGELTSRKSGRRYGKSS